MDLISQLKKLPHKRWVKLSRRNKELDFYDYFYLNNCLKMFSISTRRSCNNVSCFGYASHPSLLSYYTYFGPLATLIPLFRLICCWGGLAIGLIESSPSMTSFCHGSLSVHWACPYSSRDLNSTSDIFSCLFREWANFIFHILIIIVHFSPIFPQLIIRWLLVLWLFSWVEVVGSWLWEDFQWWFEKSQL